MNIWRPQRNENSLCLYGETVEAGQTIHSTKGNRGLRAVCHSVALARLPRALTDHMLSKSVHVCAVELTAPVISCTRSVQDWAVQCPAATWEGFVEPSHSLGIDT